MGLLESTISAISPPDAAVMNEVRERWNHLCLGTGRPGKLENMTVQFAGITGDPFPDIPKKSMIIACADHGVAVHNLSAYPISTTVGMTKNYLISKGAGANAMAAYCGADMTVVDMGIAHDMTDVPGLLDRKIAWGTDDMTEGPAMSREDALQAVETGIELAEARANEGYTAFLVGEMGISNTTSAACMLGAFNRWNAVEVTGRGTNISDERLRRKIEVVQQALDVNQPNPEDGLDVLAKVGGFELACLAGVMLGAAAHHALVIIDGFNTTAVSFAARALCTDVTGYLMASHLSAEQAHQKALRALGLEEYIDLDFRLGEASGAAIQMRMLDTALLIYRECMTEEELEEEQKHERN